MSWKAFITHEELEAVNELKRRTISDVTTGMLKDDSVFYRFCKARDFNVKFAEDMIRKHIAWRKEYKVDAILTDFHRPEVLTKYFAASHIGFDNEGSPIRYVDLGGADNKGLLDSSKQVDLIKHCIADVENDFILCKQQTEKLGKPITKVVFIINNSGLTFAKVTHKRSLEMFLLGISMYQDNYPERIKAIYFINVSYYFHVLFGIVKKVIASAILDKMHFFGTEMWKAELLNAVAADQLPAFLGGTLTDPDGNPLCKTFVVHGEKVPPKYYLQKSDRNLSALPDAKKLNLSRFSKTDIEFNVMRANSFLEWQFETKNKDIGFGVYYKPDSSMKPMELIPKQRIDTSYGPEVGTYKCERAGIYIIVFDNSYSWIYPKEVYYRARIISSTEDDNIRWE